MSKIDEARFRALTEDPATWPLIEEELRAQYHFKQHLAAWQRGLIAAYWTIVALLGSFIAWLVYLIWF